MNWHETIDFIQNNNEFNDLVKDAYISNDLKANVVNFGNSEEFIETLKIIENNIPKNAKILEIGAGNGIASINLALLGYQVTAVEPDNSNLIGSGAIEHLKEKFKLNNLTIINGFAEDIQFENTQFDMIYTRQTMHHAIDLNKFVKNSVKYLKNGGYFFSVRDHVVYNNADKLLFLEKHPLHKYYGGENAFTKDEYCNAISKAGLKILIEMKHFDSVINFAPLKTYDYFNRPKIHEAELIKRYKKKYGIIPPFINYLKKRNKVTPETFWDEKDIPGRHYTYLAKKI